MSSSIYHSNAMEPRRLSADEQRTVQLPAVILEQAAQRAVSFQDATNGAFAQPCSYPPQRFQFQAAIQDVHNSVGFYPQQYVETHFPNIQGQPSPSYASHIPSAAPGFIFDFMTDQEAEQPAFQPQSYIAESPALNLHLQAPATGVSPFPGPERLGPGDPESLFYGSPPWEEIGSFQSRWVDEELNLGSDPFSAGSDLSGQNETTSMALGYLAIGQDIPGIRYMPQSQPTIFRQHPQPYPAYSMNEMPIERLMPAPDGSALPGPNSTIAQKSQRSRSYGAPRVRKRKQDEMTDISNVESLSLSKKQWKPFATITEKEHAAQVREIGACIRCAMQRNKCRINPADPEGICLTCQNLCTMMSKLPCLRVRITGSELYRKIVDPSSGRPDFSMHFNNGILKPVKQWSAAERTIELTQGFGSILRFRVCEATALDLADITESQRFMYQCPWALADFEEAVGNVGKFLSGSIPNAVKSKVSKTDKLALGIFSTACRMARRIDGRKPSVLLRNVLMLWRASRCIEGGWRFHGSETLGLQADDKGITPLTDAPIIDAQMSSIIVLKYLNNLREKVLEQIQKLTVLGESRRKHWFELFLAYFILLHNCECVMKQQRNWARENKSPYRYTLPMMELVRGILFTVKTMLAYFHYALKGQYPFRLDWKSNKGPKIAELTDEQHEFVKVIAREVEAKAATFMELHGSTEYETDYCFVGQLFLRDWVPQSTIEYAPPAP